MRRMSDFDGLFEKIMELRLWDDAVLYMLVQL
jgi:hypothetical protein